MSMNIDWACCPDVELVPGRMGGLQVAELGETPEEIAFYYSLPLETVREILCYAATHVQAAPAP